MEKNWLIRTKTNHILGPVSKTKILELFNNGSIRSEDEVCSGNGFWFYIREKDQVEKYLLSNLTQGFNPISEAKDVLNLEHDQATGSDDVTLISLPRVKGPEHVTSITKLADFDLKKKVNTKSKTVKTSSPNETSSPIPEVPGKSKHKRAFVTTGENLEPRASGLSSTVILSAAVIIVVGLLYIFYHRKLILKDLIETTSVSLMSSAVAQDDVEKKKSY